MSSVVRVVHSRFLAMLLGCALSMSAQATSVTDPELQRLLSDVDAAALVLIDPDGDVDLAVNANDPLIPASTAKLVLTWLALQRWGEDHRIETRFFVERTESVDSARLWLQGGADPYLTSEELPGLAQRLATELRGLGIQRLSGFGVDESLFATVEAVPGGTSTDNPYDALPSALAANFNTVVVKVEDGVVVEGEPQTPVTATTRLRARELALLQTDSLPTSSDPVRVNLGFSDSQRAARYLVELLSHFLAQQGILVTSGELEFGDVADEQPILRYRSSRELLDITRDMLIYSNNFIANQLALAWSASVGDGSASFTRFADLAEQHLQHAFAWQNISVRGGAGLSRDSRLSAKQLTDVVAALGVYDDLLPAYRDGVYAKTGTLSGVSSLAGFVDAAVLPGSDAEATGIWRFSLIVNDERINDPTWRDAVLSRLLERVRGR